MNIRNYILTLSLTVLPLLAVSCAREEEPAAEHIFLSDNKMENIIVGFGDQDTKCAGSHGDTFLGESKVVTETGDTLYITAYLSDMDDEEDFATRNDTKSTLIGGANFGTADGYTSFQLNAYKEGESTVYQSVDKTMTSTPMENVAISYTGGSSDYKWSFDKAYYWPSDGKALYFCSYGPTSEFTSGGSVSDMSWDKDLHAFSFHYTTPSSLDSLDAQIQKDIIVGVDSLSYVKDGANNIALSLRHPLMAVRFVLGDIWGKIEYLSLNNFYSEGTATITSDAISWSNLTTKDDFVQFFDNFDATKYTQEQKDAGTVELDQTAKKTRNFIFIPQVLPDDALMRIKLGNNLHPIDLSFDKIVDDRLSKDWTGYAGKVLTFRVSSKNANLISVDITDTMDGCTKKDVKIFNDGKDDLYIRAVLVGNWLNSKGNILAAWDENLPYGTFYDKNGNPFDFPTVLQDNWYYNETDGFYYYTKILPSEYRISSNLFDKFTLTDMPTVENSEDPDVQLASFEMSILVQAVAAVDVNGLTREDEGWDPKYSARLAWGIDGSFLTTAEDRNILMD